MWRYSCDHPTAFDAGGSGRPHHHFGCTCYHPLFVFNQFGDVERCVLRPGNVHSADGWRALLEPVIARYRDSVKHLYFRGDAGFANPEIYELLEAEDVGYAIRLPANRILQDRPEALSSWTTSQPADRSASSCSARFWSSVETRAYPIKAMLGILAYPFERFQPF